MTSRSDSNGLSVQDNAHYPVDRCEDCNRRLNAGGNCWKCDAPMPDSCCGLPNCRDCRPENFTPREATNG